MRKVNLVFGTVYGNAQFVAETLQQQLLTMDWEVNLIQPESLSGFVPPQDEWLLVVTSTTGQGDIPDDINLWFETLRGEAPYLPQLNYGVIALGDSSYETFCHAGIRFDELLTELGANRVGELLKIDACETMEPEVAAQSWLVEWHKLIDENQVD
ncbi:flavodoxin [Shewanella colwelliana]|uniref:Flavodoxin n=1 Tax=Shewanella colwelliana TaxID=23 RepID=A0A1E5IY94_SHECO|nr:flavodoxin [Shewanella colwelliana]MCZ4338520.1 flavodoxin [Shewanella colwelliana]MDX1281700.1 flavodoxin [Shewanella colwelliana]OEG75118.1 flavodoxin [Shewanella colwelliana]GIU37503.1 flavodoxin [Shewanella colwelliana]